MAELTDRTKSAAKNLKPKRPSTTNIATSSRTKITTKEKPETNRSKKDESAVLNKELGFPEVDNEYREIAYKRYMRSMLEDCLVDEKIERDATQIDLQMTQLAERFQKTMEQLDKTNKQLKDISFVAEKKRLFDLKNVNSEQFYEIKDSKSETQELYTEQPDLVSNERQNVNLSFAKTSGQKQLLDTVNDAIEGLSNIKKEYKLDTHKFEDYHSKETVCGLESDTLDFESLRSEFAARFPNFSEQFIWEASERIASVIENDNIGDNDDLRLNVDDCVT